jgi:hypothetical protein
MMDAYRQDYYPIYNRFGHDKKAEKNPLFTAQIIQHYILWRSTAQTGAHPIQAPASDFKRRYKLLLMQLTHLGVHAVAGIINFYMHAAAVSECIHQSEDLYYKWIGYGMRAVRIACV